MDEDSWTNGCLSVLPAPIHQSLSDGEEEELEPQSTTLTLQASIPPYGQRKSWRPSKQEDFRDGGSYPECHIAQYPLEMGRKKVRYLISISG
jgi:SNW domain-containing protein 1